MDALKQQGLAFSYDKPSDILFLDITEPYAEQRIQTLEDDLVARLNPVTNQVETLELHHYMARLQAGENIRVPVLTEMRLAKTG